MNAYKCDICGALHPKTNALILVRGTRNTYSSRPKDICDDCYHAIMKVLKERSVLNNASEEDNGAQDL